MKRNPGTKLLDIDMDTLHIISCHFGVHMEGCADRCRFAMAHRLVMPEILSMVWVTVTTLTSALLHKFWSFDWMSFLLSVVP